MQTNGYVDAQFAPVRDAFLAGFDDGRDVGAAIAVVVDGHPVVDLWAGHVDRRRQRTWEQDTLCCMFSVTKAMTAVCVLQAVADGTIRLDDSVASYWPAFAANGKDAITVRQLMCHQAGLVGFHEPVDKDIYYRWDHVCEALAAETPWWPPGSAHGYHARTFGFLLGEVLRRATGQRVRDWYAEHVAEPLGLDFHIGVLPRDVSRCADMLPAKVRLGEPSRLSPEAQQMLRDLNDTSTPTGASFQNPALGPGYMNTAEFRTAEIPALNGHGTARSVAAMYAKLENLLPAEILNEATRTHARGPDRVLKSVTRFGLGLMLHDDEAPIGQRTGSFGHAGAGGSMAFYDPNAGVAFCFAMNQMQEGVVTGGTSAMHVTDVVYDCL